MRSWRKNKVTIILAVAVIIMILAPILSGCFGSTGIVAKGWSGAAISDSNIYIGSFTGTLVGLETDTGNRQFNPLVLETPTSGGFLGCGGASVTVAIYGTPVVSGDQVFVAGNNGRVYSVDAMKGIKGWLFEPARDLQPVIGGLAIDDNSLYFGTTNGYIYAVSSSKGSQTWEFKTENKIWATPLVNNGIVYIGSFDKTLYAIDAASGAEKWRFEAGGAIVSTPAIKDNVIYFGTLNRDFYALDAATGNVKWEVITAARNWYWANPVIIGNVVYAPNMDGKVYLFNTDNGQQVADPVDAGSPISSSPVVFNNNLILAGEDGQTWVLDTEKNILNKFLEKSMGKVYAPLAISNGIVYMHAQTNILFAIRADTGVILWNKPLAD